MRTAPRRSAGQFLSERHITLAKKSASSKKTSKASTQKETGSQEKGCRYFCCTDGERRGTGKAEPPAERQHQVPVRHPLCLRSAVFPAGVYPRQCRMVLYAPGHPGHFRLFHRHALCASCMSSSFSSPSRSMPFSLFMRRSSFWQSARLFAHHSCVVFRAASSSSRAG